MVRLVARLSRRVGAGFHGSGRVVMLAGMGTGWSAGVWEGVEPGQGIGDHIDPGPLLGQAKDVAPSGGDELGGGGEQLQKSTRPSPSVRTLVLTAFCLFLPEMNLSRSLRPAAGRRTRISVPSMMPVFPSAPRWSMTSARVRSRTPWLTVHPRSASKGRTSPMARVMVERSTPNQQASMSCVVACRRCTSVASSRSTNTSRCFDRRPRPASVTARRAWPCAVRATTAPPRQRIQRSGRPTDP